MSGSVVIDLIDESAQRVLAVSVVPVVNGVALRMIVCKLVDICENL
jgi:hypothetical protein